MRLNPNIADRLGNAERRFAKLKQKFAAFVKQLECFADPRYPIRGVSINTAPDGQSFTASFATAVVGFRLLLALPPEGVTEGKVVCILEAPVFTEIKPVLGSFSFKPQGDTSFETPEGADPVELEEHAIEIVLHFLNAALERAEP